MPVSAGGISFCSISAEVQWGAAGAGRNGTQRQFEGVVLHWGAAQLGGSTLDVKSGPAVPQSSLTWPSLRIARMPTSSRHFLQEWYGTRQLSKIVTHCMFIGFYIVCYQQDHEAPTLPDEYCRVPDSEQSGYGHAVESMFPATV